MRCPYCGGLNQERASFCVNCGRDLTRPPANPQHQPARSGAAPQGRSSAAPPVARTPGSQTQQQPGYAPAPPRPTGQPTYTQPTQATASISRRAPASPTQAPVAPLQVEPEPPAPFPPQTLDQLKALLADGAQTYTLVESSLGDGQKKLVRIAYPRCAGWQQAATLLKALQEQQESQYTTTIIQGVFPQQEQVYAFTNGQLQFDRNVRLGGQVGNRYIIETGNGFASDSVRFVLNE